MPKPTNEILELIEDTIIGSLESRPWLPTEFVLSLPDDAFQRLIAKLVTAKTRQPVPKTWKRVSLSIAGCRVTIRSDEDPEPWLPVPLEETRH